MNTKLITEMSTIIDLLYQNQRDVGYSWVVQNLQLIYQQVQESTIIWSAQKKIDLDEEKKIALTLIKELMELVQQNNIFKLADYLKYEIYDYIKVGATL